MKPLYYEENHKSYSNVCKIRSILPDNPKKHLTTQPRRSLMKEGRYPTAKHLSEQIK